MKNSVPSAALPALLLSALVLVPFFNKAFTVDDPLFLAQARHALSDPLHPTAFMMAWADISERVSQLVPSGAVMAWLLLPTAAANGAEWVAHATQLVMLWVAILATVSLARRMELPRFSQIAAGLLVVAMPAVLGMAGTAMPDVPAMALGVVGIERLLAWSQDRRADQALCAAIFLGLAPLTRPHLILIIAVGALLLLGPTLSLAALRERISTFLPLAAALLITLIVYFVTSDPNPEAGSLVSSTIRYSSVSIGRIAMNIVALPIHLVLTMAFALPWLALRYRTMLQSLLLPVSAAVGAVTAGIALASINRFSLPFAIIAGLGVAVVVDLIVNGVKRRDSLQLALTAWILIALPAVLYVNLPPKYLVASAPAAALLIARELSSQEGKAAWLILGITVALGTCLGVAILRADDTFASLGRRAAAELIAPNIKQGKQVWFLGHWGFQWYAENAGARPVTLDPPYPAPGDLVVVSTASVQSRQLREMLADHFPNMTPVGRIEDYTPGGRLMNKRLKVGFYSSASGYWPWVWSDSLIDQFTVWRLE